MGRRAPAKRLPAEYEAAPESRRNYPGSEPAPRPWWKSEPAAKGLRCKECHCPHVPVVYTRPVPLGRVKRHRKCRHCGYEFDTFEGGT